MSMYVMSDIHGCFDEFQKMLGEVGFSERDQLILAGDLIERGPKNYEMLRWLEDIPDNILPILGNHEHEFVQNVCLMVEMCTELIADPADPESMIRIYHMAETGNPYFDYYGSIRGLILEHQVKLDDFIRWARMFQTWPCQRKVEIQGREFIIVHAGYIEDLRQLPNPEQYADIKEFNLYAREDAYIYGGKEHATIIAGHTPTIIRHTFTSNNGKVFRYHDEEMDCVFYDIDCGGVFRHWGETTSRFACMCLEDETIKYI